MAGVDRHCGRLRRASDETRVHARPVEIRPPDRAAIRPAVPFEMCPVDVLTVDRHSSSPRSRSRDEARIDARPVEIRPPDAVVVLVYPIDVIVVDRQPRQLAVLDGDERVLDAAAVEVGTPNGPAEGEVDMLAVDR